MKTIINENNIDIKFIDCNENNGLIVACKYNENLKIIHYLSNFININDRNCFEENCFLSSCHNKNLNIVKYLVEILNADIFCKDIDFANGFLIACFRNTNVNIIKYLYEDLKFNLKSVNISGENCFQLACHKNNLSVLKFLSKLSLEDIKLTHNYGHNGFDKACSSNKNYDVIKFSINELHIDIS